MTTKLYPFTFEDSGRRVSIRKFSFNTFRLMRDKVEKDLGDYPEVPVQAVEYPNGVINEPNPQDPEYQKRLAEFRRKVNDELNDIIIDYSVVAELSDADKAEVMALREELRAKGIELAMTDKQVFLKHICLTTPEELNDLLNACMRRSLVTEDGRADAKARFQS